MSTVEQIHHLEARVDRLLATLRELRSDNDSLRGELASTEERASELERQLNAAESARQEAQQRGDELEQRLTSLHADQEEIEATITRTLDQLGKLGIGAPGDVEGHDAPGADPVEAAVAIGDAQEADPEPEAAEGADDDARADETAVLPDEQPEADDEPEADAADKEGDDLDIF